MYQPRIRNDLIARLSKLGKTLDVPMTQLASALMEYGIRLLEHTLSKNGYQASNGDASAQRQTATQPPEENV